MRQTFRLRGNQFSSFPGDFLTIFGSQRDRIPQKMRLSAYLRCFPTYLLKRIY